jgi:hypothetical protein
MTYGVGAPSSRPAAPSPASKATDARSEQRYSEIAIPSGSTATQTRRKPHSFCACWRPRSHRSAAGEVREDPRVGRCKTIGPHAKPASLSVICASYFAGDGELEPDRSWTTTALGKFWGNGSFNMTITATNAVLTKGADVNANKLVAKVVSTAVVALIPIVALSTVASAAQTHTARTEFRIATGLVRGAPNAWSSRLSGLPTGGAALFDGLAPYGGSAFYNVPAAPAAAKQSGPNAWSSRLSGLPTGGAALYS